MYPVSQFESINARKGIKTNANMTYLLSFYEFESINARKGIKTEPNQPRIKDFKKLFESINARKGIKTHFCFSFFVL